MLILAVELLLSVLLIAARDSEFSGFVSARVFISRRGIPGFQIPEFSETVYLRWMTVLLHAHLFFLSPITRPLVRRYSQVASHIPRIPPQYNRVK